MRTMSRGFGIHYTVDGEGPPLLLVAGTLLAARHWRDLGYVDALARGWRVINVDPLGHGASDRPHDADFYTAAGVTADLVAVLDAEGVERATVWGYSRGGWLTCGLASRHPERVERIVVGGYAMHAHLDEAGRVLVPLAGCLRQGDWAGVWRALGVSDSAFQRMLETDDGIVSHVHADIDSLAAVGATVDVIPGQSHLGAFFDAAPLVLSAVTERLRGDGVRTRH
ncbi:MAG: alpha/beta fold hydrolase [Mycobacterium sp.]